MQIHPTSLGGVLVITPPRFTDPRGFFSESYNRKALLDAGIDIEFVQDNHSLSLEQGTVRGLHFQAPPHAQAKLVRCGRGTIFDVAVDIRKGSSTYGNWYGAELSFENGRQLLIPAGFAHGFVTRSPEAEIVYKCSDYYAPDAEGSLLWNDPEIGIEWGLGDRQPILSGKDAEAGLISEFESPFLSEDARS